MLNGLSDSLSFDGSPHTATEGSLDPTRAGSGISRPVTIVSDLSPEEKSIFDERLKQVVATGMVSDVNQLAFTFRATDSAKIGSTSKIYLTASRGVNNDANPILNTDQSYWSGIDGKLAYTCASMVELLLCLGSSGSGLYIKGSLGVTNGFTGAAQGNMADQGGVSDHTFGRAFDINVIGKSSTDGVILSGKNIDNYRAALNMLLVKLKSIPEYLHPDLIVIHDQLVTEYGIGNGFEGDFKETNAALIIKAYPELSRINFSGDAGHRDHIHMSFGPARAGSYESWINGSTDSSNQGDPGAGDNPTGLASDISELGQSYAQGPTSTHALKNKNALYAALVQYGGYSPEAAAIWMCVAERESRFSPGGFNGAVNGSSGTPPGSGDYSIGLWQVNFFGIPSLLTSELVLASLDSTKKKIVKENGRGYKLIDKDWQANGTVNQSTAIAKMKEWYKVNPKKPNEFGISEGKTHSDPRLWNALTQIFLLEKLTSGVKDGWMWWNWGEYSGGPASGWLAKLKFQTAVNYYVANNPGKTREDLKSWIKKKGTDKNLNSSKKYLDKWLEGYVFKINGDVLEKPSNIEVPTFTKTQIKEAAIWLRTNRMDPWEKRNKNAFGCEGFANRLAAGLGLYGSAKTELFTEEWVGAGNPATNLTTYLSAQAHYNAVKDTVYFNGPTTSRGLNPPANDLVFWTGGSGANTNNGHIGISLGDGTFIDQNDTTNTLSNTVSTPKPIIGGTWPGSSYTYVGSCSTW